MPRFNNVRQLRSGRWQGRYTGPDGRRHEMTYPRAEEASAWVEDQRGDARAGHWVSPVDAGTVFAEWAARYNTARVDIRDSTRAKDDSLSRTHVLPAFGAVPIGAITQPDVSAWVASLVAKSLAGSTVRSAYQVLAGLMAGAADARVIRTSPCYAVKLPPVNGEEHRFLTPAEIGRLHEMMVERYRALVLLSCYGGLRIGEVAGLNRSHVNIATARVRVEQTAVEVRGTLGVHPPKTKAGRRTVALPSFVVRAMADHLATFTAPGDGSPVFPGADGARMRPGLFRSRQWQAAVKAADLAPLRIHDMRHTAVALWIATGAPVLQVSRQAGHSKVAFTLDRYGHLYDDAAETLTAGLEALGAGSVGRDTSNVVALRSLRRNA